MNASAELERAFQKAPLLLDNEEADAGEALLRSLIPRARAAAQPILLTRALCVLGEYLLEQGHAL